MFRFIKSILRILVLCIMVSVLVYTYARYLEPKMLQTKDITILSTQVQNQAENLTIVAFADTHFSEYYTCKDFQKVVTQINSLNPDLVFFLGDLIDNYDTYDDDTNEISKQLSSIEAKIGKLAIFGNHDYGGGSENYYETIMNDGGFHVLINEYYGLDDSGIGIIGIDDMLIGYGNSEIASYSRPDYFNLVLCHEPDVIDEILNYNVDLMLSGHTHGRQVDIPLFDSYILPPYGKKYPKGHYTFENERRTQLYVNSGLGTTKLPLRFLSPPEITHLLLQSETNED
ncbi:metallophosphoesterase [Sinanaerobacter sp. ZZT-01]|uniref:metallophosphoesterase n=1 Tax=Sinanaerobacter sp. ZZT-01 TaxID=3111540 RepID=UPI002D76A074|nr:metallophosphoesterase [Sinanaerobacter sp. ZZT-01]WRR93524.1 metallophosphoesterase [Sinanaerobacter sp. ZZT-01]